MSVTLGRLGESGLTFNPSAISEDHQRLTLKGRFVTSTPDEVRYVASMFPALANPDEPIIPVVFDESPNHLNGFYRVTSASADGAADAIDNGYLDWDLQLVPIQGRALPAIESILDTVLRDNSVSVTAADSAPWHATPSSVDGIYSDGGTQSLVLDQEQQTETGEIRVGFDSTSDPPFRRTSTWRCRPEDWYLGAATVERKWGSTWLPVVGRDPHLVSATDLWGISNGIVRCRIDPADPTKFIFECWDGGWESATTIRFEVYASPPYAAPVFASAAALAVIRNNPAEVRVRVTTTGIATPGLLDMRLRRGATIVECRWALPGSTSGYGYPRRLDIDPTPAAWTTIGAGGGRYATSADAAGNKLMQLWPITNENTTVDTWDTAIGFELPSDPQNATSAKAGYFAATAEHVRVVGA